MIDIFCIENEIFIYSKLHFKCEKKYAILIDCVSLEMDSFDIYRYFNENSSSSISCAYVDYAKKKK